MGLFVALLLVLGVRTYLGEDAFAAWGWRIPFLVSIVLLAVSLWIRLQLNESPMFLRMKEEGKRSKAPLKEAFGTWRYARIAILALLGATAGEAVVWYGGQFYALFFLTTTLSIKPTVAQIMIAIALALGTPFFILFGWLSDKIGRKPIIMAGFALAALTYFPIFHAHHALREPRSGSGPRQLAGDGHGRSGGMRLSVQSGRHGEIQEFLRHREVRSGQAVGQLSERGGAAGHQGLGPDRR